MYVFRDGNRPRRAMLRCGPSWLRCAASLGARRARAGGPEVLGDGDAVARGRAREERLLPRAGRLGERPENRAHRHHRRR